MSKTTNTIKLKARNWRQWLVTGIVFVVAMFLQAIAIQLFMTPRHIFTGGLTGFAQLFSILSENIVGFSVQTGTVVLIINVIVGLIGLKYIGGTFVLLSFLQAVATGLLMNIMPIGDITKGADPLLAAIFGGLLIGLSVGLTMRYGFSTGGADIIAMIIQKRTGRSIGIIMIILNAAIVLIAGLAIGWVEAMYTMVSIYAMSQAIDLVYTNQQKLTAMIVTKKGGSMVKALQHDLIRGITILPSKGGFSGNKSETLMMVVNRVELYSVREIALSVDENAFINIFNTTDIAGAFYDADKQAEIKKSRG